MAHQNQLVAGVKIHQPFDREIGKILHERGSVDSDPVPPWAVTIVDFDPLHATTG
jgi:hypothetical protein